MLTRNPATLRNTETPHFDPIFTGGKSAFFLSTLRFNHIRPNILYTLTFRLPPEVFIRRMKSSFLHPVLGTVSNKCTKKTVVRMTELVAALLPVHGSLSFLADVDCLLEPSGRSVDH